MTEAAWLEFTVVGQPTTKKRPRVLKSGRTYTPRETVNGEAVIGWEARAAMGSLRTLAGPLRVEVDFYVKAGVLPDIDNLAKSLLDGCNQVAWKDDRQIVDLHLTRLVSDEPRTVVRVWALNEPDDLVEPQLGEPKPAVQSAARKGRGSSSSATSGSLSAKRKRKARIAAQPGGVSSRHLPECDGAFCMAGCPVFGEQFFQSDRISDDGLARRLRTSTTRGFAAPEGVS